MKNTELKAGVPGFLRSGPLCGEEFRVAHDALPQAYVPRWMKWLLVAAVLTCGFFALATLLGPMDEYIMASGEVRPERYAYVFARGSGLLKEILVEEGDEVEAGRVLARLENADIERRVGWMEVQIEESEVELALAKATRLKVGAVPVPPEFFFSNVEMQRQQEIQSLQQDYLARLETLEKTGATSVSELLNLRLQLIATDAMLKRSQQANSLLEGDYGQAAREEASLKVRLMEMRLSRLRQELEYARQDLADLEVRAPEGGEILADASLKIGARVKPGEVLFKLAESGDPILRLYAGEDRIDRVQAGQVVRFRSNNNPDRLAPMGRGVVVEVARDLRLESSPPSDVLADERLYAVTVRIEEEPYPLAIGASVQAEIILAHRPFWHILLLPSQR